MMQRLVLGFVLTLGSWFSAFAGYAAFAGAPIAVAPVVGVPIAGLPVADLPIAGAGGGSGAEIGRAHV